MGVTSRDRYQPDETFVDDPAPASSFYHVSLAVAELDRVVSAMAAPAVQADAAR